MLTVQGLGKFGTNTGTRTVGTPEYPGSALESALGTETLTSIKLNYCTINRDKRTSMLNAELQY